MNLVKIHNNHMPERHPLPSAAEITERQSQNKVPIDREKMKYHQDEINFAFYYIRSRSGRDVPTKLLEYKTKIGNERARVLVELLDKIVPSEPGVTPPTEVLFIDHNLLVMPPDPGELPPKNEKESIEEPPVPRIKYLLELLNEMQTPYIPVVITKPKSPVVPNDEMQIPPAIPHVRQTDYFVFILPQLQKIVAKNPLIYSLLTYADCP